MTRFDQTPGGSHRMRRGRGGGPLRPVTRGVGAERLTQVAQAISRVEGVPYDCVIVDRLLEPEPGACVGRPVQDLPESQAFWEKVVDPELPPAPAPDCHRPAFWLITTMVGETVQMVKSCDWHVMGIVHDKMSLLP